MKGPVKILTIAENMLMTNTQNIGDRSGRTGETDNPSVTAGMLISHINNQQKKTQDE